MRTKLQKLAVRVAIVAAIAAPSCCAAAQNSPVGQVLSVTPGVQLQAGRKARSAETFTLLTAGDVLRVPPKGQLNLVLFSNGQRYRLLGSTVKVDQRAVKALSGATPEALPSFGLHLVRPMSTRQRTFGMLVRSGATDEAPFALSPVGAVRSREVTLRWQLPKVAESLPAGETPRLIVRVNDLDTRLPVPVPELPPTATEYRLSSAVLPPGHRIEWSVALVGRGVGVRRRQARFWVLTPAELSTLREIETAVQAIHRSGDSAQLADLELLQAQRYEEVGLLPEALAAYRAARRKTPSDPILSAAVERLEQLTDDPASGEPEEQRSERP